MFFFCPENSKIKNSKLNTNPKNSKSNTNPENSKSNTTYSQYKHTQKILNQTQYTHNTNTCTRKLKIKHKPKKFKIKHKPRKLKIKHNILTIQTQPEIQNQTQRAPKYNTNP